MKFGSIQVTKKMKDGECDHCEEPLELGSYYTTITIKARSKTGKHWFHNWRLHLKCLGIWLLAQLVARQDRRKKAGRPKGTGLKISPEDKKKRLALCKKRIRILQEVATCQLKDARLELLYQRFDTVIEEINAVGGPASINHRTTLNIPSTLMKLEYGRSLSGRTR